MKDIVMQHAKRAAACLLALATLAQTGGNCVAEAYVLNRNIAHTGSCPVPQRWAATTPGIVKRRWSTSLPASPQTVFTQAGELPVDQIDRAIRTSFDVWTSVGTSLTPASLGSLTQTPTQNACSPSDGLNSICFNQTHSAFTGSVLAFTIAVSWDTIGVQPFPPNSPTTSVIGEIVDADVYFRPDGQFTFATREALGAHTSSFDLESVLTHELGHFFGFSHSAVMRAMMFPFASPGISTGGVRCTPNPPGGPNTPCDLPLADDDRAGLRVLYPNPADPNIGTISGFILPANPLTLAGLPSATAGKPQPPRPVTGIFGAHVVAVDAATGAVVAGTLGGWSCTQGQQLPSNFDGFYKIEGLPVNRSYKIFVEPLDSPTTPADISNALDALCSQVGTNDVCTPPTVHTGFTTKIKPQ
jgi:hypothetical protein